MVYCLFSLYIFMINYGDLQTDDVTTSSYYIVQWTAMPYVL